jgi:uncharacterized heparinase superfamily protein
VSLARTFRTVRHLRPVQITNRIRRKIVRAAPRPGPPPPLRSIGALQPPCARPESPAGAPGSRLALYNLHYHDALRAPGIGAGEKGDLVRRWIAKNPPLRGGGWEPYPLSLRIVNWIFWSLRDGPAAADVAASLAVQVRALEDQLEYHLLGNHLWANAKALVFAGLFFAGPEAESWLARGLAIAEAERREQFLPDGGHFELSPTYHQLMTEDLLDLVNLAAAAGFALDSEWAHTAGRCLRWLGAMTRPDGRVPLFNDAADGVSPATEELNAYAARLGFGAAPALALGLTALGDSGYYRWSAPGLDIWADMGRIGPDYLPGHAHADCFTFELFADGAPAIVDTGVSTYEPGPLRAYERGTTAHNTVTVGGEDMAEMWASFRVGRRPKVSGLEVDARAVAAEHDGYARLGVRHRRGFAFDEQGVTITDELRGARPGTARLHFAPGIAPRVEGPSVIAGPVRIAAEGATGMRIERCEIARRFGAREPAMCLGFDFAGRLVTRIERCASSS